KWLEQGEADHDSRWLLKVVDEALCSRPGERALDLLGDWAFERGDFDSAERWWRLLVPPLGAETPSQNGAAPAASWDERVAAASLAYPGTTLDPARIRAKQFLARWFRGEMRDRGAVLAAYRAAHGQA